MIVVYHFEARLSGDKMMIKFNSFNNPLKNAKRFKKTHFFIKKVYQFLSSSVLQRAYWVEFKKKVSHGDSIVKNIIFKF